MGHGPPQGPGAPFETGSAAMIGEFLGLHAARRATGVTGAVSKHGSRMASRGRRDRPRRARGERGSTHFRRAAASVARRAATSGSAVVPGPGSMFLSCKSDRRLARSERRCRKPPPNDLAKPVRLDLRPIARVVRGQRNAGGIQCLSRRSGRFPNAGVDASVAGRIDSDGHPVYPPDHLAPARRRVAGIFGVGGRTSSRGGRDRGDGIAARASHHPQAAFPLEGLLRQAPV